MSGLFRTWRVARCAAARRNRIVHGYWSIDLEILHTKAADLLPALVEQLRRVLTVLEAED